MNDYYIGTAGWSYQDWEGIVYPRSKPQGFHPLVFLARFIDIIEINSTFYRIPNIRMSLSWVNRVAGIPRFLFTVKIHQVFTHQRREFGQKEIDSFKQGIEPLHTARRLAAILLQFPWSFMRSPEHLAYLDRLFQSFGEFPLSVEVRHASWNDKDFFNLLKEHKVAYCNLDQPIFPHSLPPTAFATRKEFSYVRLHGRNRQNWFRKNAGRDERYDYLYSRDELSEWVDRIRNLGKKSDKVFVITNNHYQGQALTNAIQIKNMISGEKMDIPLSLIDKYPALNEIIHKIKEGQLDLFKEKPDRSKDTDDEPPSL